MQIVKTRQLTITLLVLREHSKMVDDNRTRATIVISMTNSRTAADRQYSTLMSVSEKFSFHIRPILSVE